MRPRVAHRRAPVFGSWTEPGGGFAAHRYLGRLRLPGRYLVDGVSLEARPDAGRLRLARLAVYDALTRRPHAGLAARDLRERHRRSWPSARSRRSCASSRCAGSARAWVAQGARVLADDEAVAARAGRAGCASGIDPRRDALVTAADARALRLAPGAPARARGGRSRAADRPARHPRRGTGPAGGGGGLGPRLVGGRWTRRRAALVRVNHAQMAVPLGPGIHRVVFAYRAPGLAAGRGPGRPGRGRRWGSRSRARRAAGRG